MVQPDDGGRRRRRARRRRLRRVFGTLVFLAIGVGICALAYFTFKGSDDDSAEPVSSTVLATTTPPIPPAGPFKVTDGVNVRKGPGTSFERIATIDQGKEVMVVCVTEGGVVTGPNGPTTKWVRVTSGSVTGYVTSEFVATGAALDNPAVIPRCTST
jgi:hypothetical protein